jgi:hypothetical protein
MTLTHYTNVCSRRETFSRVPRVPIQRLKEGYSTVDHPTDDSRLHSPFLTVLSEDTFDRLPVLLGKISDKTPRFAVLPPRLVACMHAYTCATGILLVVGWCFRTAQQTVLTKRCKEYRYKAHGHNPSKQRRTVIPSCC